MTDKLDVIRFAKGLRSAGFKSTQAQYYLEIIAKQNGCVPDLNGALHELSLVYEGKPDKVSISEQVENAIKLMNTNFELTQLCKSLTGTNGVLSQNDYQAVIMKLQRMCGEEEPRIRQDRKGKYTKTTPADMMDFSQVDTTKTMEVYLPFHLEDFFKIYPKNVFIFSGVSNFGKTEMLLWSAYLNQHRPTIYINTEMAPEEMKDRIQEYQPWDAWRTVFPKKVASEDVADIIGTKYKDHIVFVDYLTVYEDYFGISALIAGIEKKLDKGIVFIGLQKNKNTDWARGGSQTMDLSRLYMNFDPGPVDHKEGFDKQTTKMSIVKMKNLRYPGRYNAYNWEFIFSIDRRRGDMPVFKKYTEPEQYTEFYRKQKDTSMEF